MKVTVNYLEGWKFESVCGDHKVTVDLPTSSGGKDEAPTPPQYFLTSLASCVGVYVVSYCESARLDAKGMQISITADKISHPNRIDNIKIDITLPNAQVGKRKEALLSVAKNCLIHNTMLHHPKMDINLVSE